jgi:hypothetical protein
VILTTLRTAEDVRSEEEVGNMDLPKTGSTQKIITSRKEDAATV